MTDEEMTPSDSPMNGEENASETIESIGGATAPRQDDTASQAEEYLAGWKRALADYENLVKHNATARDDDRRRVRIQLAHELLPVIDNFDQSLKFAPTDLPDNATKWFQGIQHIGRQFAEVLNGIGIEPIPADGEQFNPNVHESVGARHEEGKAEGVILEQVTRGWKIGDVVLRPSKVIVNEKT